MFPSRSLQTGGLAGGFGHARISTEGGGAGGAGNSDIKRMAASTSESVKEVEALRAIASRIYDGIREAYDGGQAASTLVQNREPDHEPAQLRWLSHSLSESAVVQHVSYICSGLRELRASFVSLDASRPWLLFWMLHGLSLLGVEYSEETEGLRMVGPKSVDLDAILEAAPDRSACIEFLLRCQNSSGGFGGGPQQLSHVATTYAAVSSLVIIGGEQALGGVDRAGMLAFLHRLQVKEEGEYRGAFRVHVGGEVDLRASYLAMAVVRLLKLDFGAEGIDAMAGFVKRCQTYEGGLGGEPGNEAHGGYTYCGFAALVLAGRGGEVDTWRMLEWAVSRQENVEGGFNGRTNKLVDSCYSFWLGSLICLLQRELEAQGSEGVPRIDAPKARRSVFNPCALQEWILHCCQMQDGGFRDKPGVRQDFYHTCYALSGLSLAMHNSGHTVSLDSDCGVCLHETDLLLNIRCDKLKGWNTPT